MVGCLPGSVWETSIALAPTSSSTERIWTIQESWQVTIHLIEEHQSFWHPLCGPYSSLTVWCTSRAIKLNEVTKRSRAPIQQEEAPTWCNSRILRSILIVCDNWNNIWTFVPAVLWPPSCRIYNRRQRMRLLCHLRGGGRGAFRTYPSALLSDRLLNWTPAKAHGNSTARFASRRPYWCRVCHRRRQMGCCDLLAGGLFWAEFDRSNGAPVRSPIDAAVCKRSGRCALYWRR